MTCASRHGCSTGIRRTCVVLSRSRCKSHSSSGEVRLCGGVVFTQNVFTQNVLETVRNARPHVPTFHCRPVVVTPSTGAPIGNNPHVGPSMVEYSIVFCPYGQGMQNQSMADHSKHVCLRRVSRPGTYFTKPRRPYSTHLAEQPEPRLLVDDVQRAGGISESIECLNVCHGMVEARHAIGHDQDNVELQPELVLSESERMHVFGARVTAGRDKDDFTFAVHN